MTPGPKAIYDISKDATARATNIGQSIRGMDQLVNAIADVFRGLELGVRYFRVTDEGLLVALSDMRKRGLIPRETKFKVSADFPTANPLTLRFRTVTSGLLNKHDTVNIARDLPLPILSAMRAVTDNPIDVHVHHLHAPPSNILRNLDAPEIVRLTSPVNLKSSVPYAFAGEAYGAFKGEEAYKMLKSVQEAIERYCPEAKQTKPGANGLAVPVEPGNK